MSQRSGRRRWALALAAVATLVAAPLAAEETGRRPFLLGGIQVNESDHERWAAALLRSGMNAVEVTAYAHQSAWNGSELWFADEEPAVLAEIRAARRNGLEVVLILRVALDQAYPENRFLWHGLIYPETEEQLEEWFRRYTAFAVKWARIARDEGVDVLGIGAEMNSLSATLPVAEVPELPAYYLDADKQQELRALVARYEDRVGEEDLAAMGAGDFTSLEEFLRERNRAERSWARLYSFAGEPNRVERINRRRRLLLEHWRNLIAAVRASYRGRLTLASNFDNYQEVAFWKELDLIGINAYFPLRPSLASPLDEKRLREAWREIFADIERFQETQEMRREVLFTELGYTRRSGVTVAPWGSSGLVPIWDPPRKELLIWSQQPMDDSERALAVRALFSAWHADDLPLAGLFYWKLSSRLDLRRYEPFMLYLGPEAGDPLYEAVGRFARVARPPAPPARPGTGLYSRWREAVARGDVDTARALPTYRRGLLAPATQEPLLHVALRLGRSAIVRDLVRRGANPNRRDRAGLLALHWSCYQEDAELVELVLPEASVSWSDRRGETPLHKCARLDNAAVLGELLARRPELARARNARSRTALWLAADQASAKTVDLLVRSDGGVELVDESGAAPIHVAASRGDPEIVERLLEASGGDARDRWGYPPAHYAAYHGRGEAFRRLWNPDGERQPELLHQAAHGGSVEILEALLATAPDLDRADRDGRTPLHIAVMKAHVDAVRLLLERGAEIGIADLSAKSALHLAAEGTSTAILRLLLSRRPELDRGDREGQTPLHLAASWGRVDNARLLLEAGARDDLADAEGRTALEVAEDLERGRVAELLRARRGG